MWAEQIDAERAVNARDEVRARPAPIEPRPRPEHVTTDVDILEEAADEYIAAAAADGWRVEANHAGKIGDGWGNTTDVTPVSNTDYKFGVMAMSNLYKFSGLIRARGYNEAAMTSMTVWSTKKYPNATVQGVGGNFRATGTELPTAIHAVARCQCTGEQPARIVILSRAVH